QPCDRCVAKELTCRFRGGARTAACVECQKRAVKCANAKGVADPDIQERLDKKSGDEPSPARKRTKKSAPIVVDEDAGSPTPPPSKSKGKARASGPPPQEVIELDDEEDAEKETEAGPSARKSAGKGKGAEKGSEKRAEKRAEPGLAAAADYGRRVRLALGTEGRWSPDPAKLSDRELLERLLVEGQQTRRALEVLGQYLEHEVPIREALVQREVLVVRAAVQESVSAALGRWADSEVRTLVREEIDAAFERFFPEEEQEEQEKAAEETGEVPEGPETPEVPE
ncbi:hypothetical protein BV20DRAFT_1058422, partial [Pilatotrama ljubarskyi]